MEEVITDLYEVLIHLEYPGVADSSLKDFESIILHGSNRTKLLCWLINKYSAHHGACLENIEDTALQDKLHEYYFQLGICNNKDELMGRSTNSAQISFLKRLRIFMKNMVITHSNIINPLGKNTVEQILNDLDKGTNIIPSSCNIRKNIETLKATAYMKNIKKKLIEVEDQQILDDLVTDLDTEELQETSSNDVKDALLVSTVAQNFITAFEIPVNSIVSTPAECSTRYKNLMDHEIRNIYENFSSLNQILRSRTMVSNFMNTDLLDKTNTPLTQMMEDAVIYIEEIHNLINKDN